MNILEKILIPEVYLPIIYILIGFIIYSVIKKVIIAVFSRYKSKSARNNKRYNTLMSVVIDIIKIIIVTFVILSVLTVYGIDVAAALAGLGIVSVLIGLAFQDLFKDVIVGFFIIIEDQFSVGDTIEVGGFKGEVLHVGMKSTKIKKFDGPIMIIANRNIDKVINYTNTESMAIVDIPVAYEEDIDHVEKLLTDLAKKLDKKLEHLKGEIEVWGVENLDSSAVVIRLAVRTEVLQHFSVQRQIRKEVKNLFNKEGIKIPYPQVEVHNGK
ncbi:MAG: mechanosensitive ion channel family protein [Bacilli bacterium]|nr:mechanosensitive ion channel family protein [Bacilli bacterium]